MIYLTYFFIYADILQKRQERGIYYEKHEKWDELVEYLHDKIC